MKQKKTRTWIASIAKTSSLEVPPGTFKSRDPKAIAMAVKTAAERAKHADSAYASAMSYLCFYLNRGGKTLPQKTRRTVERAKKELRLLFERPT